ncbi:MAG TPA: hypothetical protein VNM40_00340 [Candidatus Paceibacterota bacterium]|nr:hypothetical protein [Candidatus Paceibacterota bacterium]
MTDDEIKQQFEELAESIKVLSEKQNSQYTDVMLLLKKVEEKLESLDENNSTISFFDDDETYEEASLLPDGKEDELYEDVKAAVQEAGKVSVPFCNVSLILDMLAPRGS